MRERLRFWSDASLILRVGKLTADSSLLQSLLDAVDRGDWDRAMQLGLMEVDIDSGDARSAPLLQLQTERRAAFAARARYQAKKQRESLRTEELAAKRAARSATASDVRATLPSAAQLALQRALQRVKAKQA